MQTDNGEPQSRQTMALMVLSGLLLIPGGVWGAMSALDDYSKIAEHVPVIRLTGGLFTPFLVLLLTPFGVFMVLVGALSLMKRDDLIQRLRDTGILKKLVYPITAVMLLGIFTQPIVTRLVMPLYGYHICQKLEGGLSMWHNDWVQNPDWCVRSKTHDWVRAMAAREAGADIDPDEAQKQGKESRHAPLRDPITAYLWLLGGGLVGAAFWGNEFRHWPSVRRKHFLVRWLASGIGALVASFFSGLLVFSAYGLSGERHWVGILMLMLVVSWPLFGFLDHRDRKTANNLKKVSFRGNTSEIKPPTPQQAKALIPKESSTDSPQEAVKWWACLESPARKNSSYFLVVDSRWRDHPTNVTTFERAVLSEEEVRVAIDAYPWAGEVEAADVKGSCGALFFVRQFASGETAQYQLTPWTDDAVLLDLDISKNDNSWLRPLGHSREIQFGEVSIEVAKQRVRELFNCSFEQAWDLQHPRP